MSKKIIAIGLLLIGNLILVMNGCTKNTTVSIDNTPEITTPVSFSKDLVPLFTKNCATSGCHSGSVAPNLSVTTAYDAIQNTNLVNAATPANSELYLWLTGKRAVAMPAGSANNPSNINALVLAWIKQGAKNN
ncbi:MAG: hypothetical protein ABI367_02910 [Mucilaginibacter sp.]